MKIILPVVFFVIFLLLYMIFHSLTEAMVLILPTFYARPGTGGVMEVKETDTDRRAKAVRPQA